MSFLSFSSAVSAESWRRLLKRLQSTSRRARNEGVLYLILAVACALVAAAALRLLLIERAQAIQQDQELFTKTFGVRQEERELPYPGVVAGLLGTINYQVDDVHCVSGSPLLACRQKEALLQTVDRLFALALDTNALPYDQSQESANCGEKLPGGVRDLLLGLWAGAASDEGRRCAWMRAALQSIAAARTDKNREVMIPCPDSTNPAVAKSHGVGQAACEVFRRPGSPASLIPAQLTDFAVAARIQDHSLAKEAKVLADWIPDWEGDAKEIAGVAKLIDVAIVNAMAIVGDKTTAVAADGEVGGADGTGPPGDSAVTSLLEGAELRQAYFISPDNFLRIWTVDGDPIKDLPRTRQWSAAAYMRPFIVEGSRSPVRTRAYLDLGGNGLVSTECRPLWLGRGDSSVFLGAVCADLTLNITQNKELLKRLVSNRFLQIEPITVSMHNGATQVDSINLTIAPPYYDRRALTAAIDASKSGIAEISQTVRSIDVAGEAAFIVPIGKVSENKMQALVVSPAKSRGLGSRQSLLTIVLGISGFAYAAFTIMGVIKRREDEAVRSDLVIFRSLQTGVIETMIDGEQIVRANDRAEELLGITLPKVRTVATNSPLVYTRQFDLALEIIGDRWPDVKDSVDTNPPSYRELSGAEIYRRRTQGRTSRYWIHLRDKAPEEGWLVVQAGPLVRETSPHISGLLRPWSYALRAHETKAVGTYGTMERASSRRIRTLAAEWQIWHRKRRHNTPCAPLSTGQVVPRDEANDD